MKYLGLLFCLMSLSACVNPVNIRTAENYYEAGTRGEQRGNLKGAKESYTRALINARLGGMGPGAESNIEYRLGVVSGNLCEHDEAEKYFLDSITSVKKYSKDERDIFLPYYELAQMHNDIGKHDKAVKYYAEVLKIAEKLFKEKDPISLAYIYDDYAASYKGIGNLEKYNKYKELANGLRNINPGAEAKIIKSKENYTPYPKVCGIKSL